MLEKLNLVYKDKAFKLTNIGLKFGWKRNYISSFILLN